MELARYEIKRWPGQLCNTLEEVTQAELDAELEDLLDEADRLKRFPTRDIRPVREATERVGFSVSVWRSRIPAQPRFAGMRKAMGAGLWEILGFCRLYRLRDAVMENLGCG